VKRVSSRPKGTAPRFFPIFTEGGLASNSSGCPTGPAMTLTQPGPEKKAVTFFPADCNTNTWVGEVRGLRSGFRGEEDSTRFMFFPRRPRRPRRVNPRTAAGVAVQKVSSRGLNLRPEMRAAPMLFSSTAGAKSRNTASNNGSTAKDNGNTAPRLGRKNQPAVYPRGELIEKPREKDRSRVGLEPEAGKPSACLHGRDFRRFSVNPG